MDRIGSSIPVVRSSLLILVLSLVATVLGSDASFAERLSFRAYGDTEGLTSYGGSCADLVGPGFLLVCSEHGVFSYNGRKFENLGTAQGLIDGGVVEDIAVIGDGRVALRYPDKVFISDAPVSIGRPPASLEFKPVNLGGVKLYDEYPKQMAWTGKGLALIAGKQTMLFTPSASGENAVLKPVKYDPVETAALLAPRAVFSVRDRLWETFDDGRVCSADPSFVRCFGKSQGLVGGPWEDIAAGDGDTVFARSATAVATIQPRSGLVRVEQLPDQVGQYASFPRILSLFRTPSGELATQSSDGLIIRRHSGWSQLTTSDGIPSGLITDIMDDRSGQLWVEVYGRGLFRGLGYGHWEGLQREDGLSVGSAWEIVREGHSLWVSTDTGIDEVTRDHSGVLGIGRIIPTTSYALAVGPKGKLWSSDGKHGAVAIDPSTGAADHIDVPAVNAISAGAGSRMWLGTTGGLFHVDADTGKPLLAIADGKPDHIMDLAPDGSGGIWLIAGGKLWHRHLGGQTDIVTGEWPSGEFEPLVMAPVPGGHIWIGGAGGLFELTISADRVTQVVSVSPSDLRTNTVVAVMADRRGWVWAGTGLGVAVFNGHRWVSADNGTGLVFNDISQNGIYEDSDGSVLITTGLGISHLLDPAWLFSDRPISVAISEALLGRSRLAGSKVPFTEAPLSLQFGTFSYASERSVVFRYRLSGVDDGWEESATGAVHYPSIPPGRHTLQVVARDVLSHVDSDPVSLVVDVGYPWWRTWWAETLYVLAGAGTLYAIIKLKDRASMRTQRKLEALVEQSTREMRIAQDELRRQATLDAMTGLLNRGEVEKRLANRLSSSAATGELLIAMLDIDHFKRINDTHGHLVGDELIRALGVRISALMRDGDYAGRYGGEEFILVLDDADGRGAERILGFHRLVRDSPFPAVDAVVSLTCSIGLAWAAPGDDWTSLIGRADAALYEAKASGRDKIVESQDEHPVTRTGDGHSGVENTQGSSRAG